MHKEPPAHAPNAALMIDFDNVTMAIRSDLQTELKRLLQSEIIRGKVAVQRAYADLPSEEAERARRVVEAFEEAEAAGSASIQVDGRFVDYPIYERAKQKLRLYRALRAEGVGGP